MREVKDYMFICEISIKKETVRNINNCLDSRYFIDYIDSNMDIDCYNGEVPEITTTDKYIIATIVGSGDVWFNKHNNLCEINNIKILPFELYDVFN